MVLQGLGLTDHESDFIMAIFKMADTISLYNRECRRHTESNIVNFAIRTLASYSVVLFEMLVQASRVALPLVLALILKT